MQQPALPSSSNASGFFVTQSSSYLTSVFQVAHSWLGQEPDCVRKVDEEGIAFHAENQMPPTVAILDLGCTRAMARNAINTFCEYVDKHDCGLWYKKEETSSRLFLANSQQTRCTEKLVIHMYDKACSGHVTTSFFFRLHCQMITSKQKPNTFFVLTEEMDC